MKSYLNYYWAALLCFSVVYVWYFGARILDSYWDMGRDTSHLHCRAHQHHLSQHHRYASNPSNTTTHPLHVANRTISVGVLMDSLTYDKLRYIGGTGHWFHFIERILPYIEDASTTLWPQDEHIFDESTNSILYIIFQEDLGPKNLDSFTRLMLSSILSGGKYTQVVIGHSDEIRKMGDIHINEVKKREKKDGESSNSADMLDNHGDGHEEGAGHGHPIGSPHAHLSYIPDFTEQATLLFYPHSDPPQAYVEDVPQSHHHLLQSNICVDIRLKIGWKWAPKKRYDLLGHKGDRYRLLHRAIDKSCGLVSGKEHGNGNIDSSNVAAIDDMDEIDKGKLFGLSVKEMNLLRKQIDNLMPDDLTAPFENPRFTRKIRNWMKRLSRLDPTEFGILIKEMEQRWAEKRREDVDNDKELVADIQSMFTSMIKEGPEDGQVEKDKDVNTKTKEGNGLEHNEDAYKLIDNSLFLKPASIATEVPLNVLIYNRDTSRRLVNLQDIVDRYTAALTNMEDVERHSYFPVTYAPEKKPVRKPRLGVGVIGESRKPMRRKGGEFIEGETSWSF